MRQKVQYVPILQGRRGELTALRDLPDHVRKQCVPLIEVPAIPSDERADEPSWSLGYHLRRFPAAVAGAQLGWHPLFVDLSTGSLAPDAQLGGQHPLEILFDGFHAEGLTAVPVTGLDRTLPFQEAVRRISGTDRCGACIRISRDALGAGLAVGLAAVIAATGVTTDEVDIVLDLGALRPDDVQLAALGIVSLLQQEFGAPWRTVTIAAGAFPKNIADLPQRLSTVPRADWAVWSMVCGLMDPGSRWPGFGDYAIQAPGVVERDPLLQQLTANIRYTGARDWLVARGEFVLGRSTTEYGEYHRLCGLLTERPEFRGPDFSPGDHYIAQCAAGEVEPGDPETWRQQGTSHHLATVVEQLANLDAS